MSSLRPEGRWQSPPPEALELGQALGLVGPAWTAGHYVFPLSRLLSFVTLPSNWQAVEMIEHAVKNHASATSLSSSASFATGDSRGIILVQALLRCVLSKQGSLLYHCRAPEARLLALVTTCLGIPQTRLPHSGLVVLGGLPLKWQVARPPIRFPASIQASGVALWLEANSELPLLRSDVETIAEEAARYATAHMGVSQRVYRALQGIGKPAHYSQITDMHNSMFPERALTERNVHATLGREQYGVVWIGLKGTFALREWGYDRPSKTLFEAVAEIVQRKHQATGRPVPFVVIQSEVGKYRRAVTPASLQYAAHFNPKLRRVGRDLFVPVGPAEQRQEEPLTEDLDALLKQFERAQGRLRKPRPRGHRRSASGRDAGQRGDNPLGSAAPRRA